ncbi:MAG: hypothetical protein FWC45_03120 [Treponema sp.]|nr:hypothetical protein [Treponema sp.]
MFSGEIKELLVQVITSWQVLAVTGVLIVYIFLVNFVARVYHRRPRRAPLPKVKAETPDAQATSAVTPSDSDDLGLEEEEEEEEKPSKK